MSTQCRRRLLKDLRKFENDKMSEIEGVLAAPEENDILNWEAAIFG